MGMFDFRVTPDDGAPFDVEAASRDVLVWERTNTAKPRAVFSDLLSRTSLTDMYHLAWIAAKRQGLYDGDLKTFQETCDVTGGAGPEEDPTPPARSSEA